MNKTQYEFFHETKEHTPLDFPYNTYLCSIPMDFKSVKIHWHDEIEIIVIKKGEGTVFVNLTPYTVTSGDIVFIFSGQLHSIEQKDELAMEYENIIFKPSLLKSSGYDFCSDNFLKLLFSGRLEISPVINSTNQKEIQSLIEKIDILQIEKPYGYQLGIKGKLFEIMSELVKTCAHSRTKSENSKILDKLKVVLTYISKNYQNPISIEEISAQCFYSKSYFMKFFKEATGMGFISYLNDYRLEIAAGLLKSTSDNIITIAESSGFENLSYFNRSFKKKYGVTPGKYRSAQ